MSKVLSQKNTIASPLVDINSWEELLELSRSFCVKYSFPTTKDSIKEYFISSIHELEKFKELKALRLKLATNLDRLGINHSRNDILYAWMHIATKQTSIFHKSFANKSLLFETKQYSINNIASLIKLYGLTFDILVDDIGDLYPYEQALKILDTIKSILEGNYSKSEASGVLSYKEQSYCDFVNEVWASFTALARLYMKNDYIFTLTSLYLELVNTSRICSQINDLVKAGKLKEAQIISEQSQKVYAFGHKMQIIINHVIDLGLIANEIYLSKDDLKYIMQVSYYLQNLGRISNDISTWKRELESMDYTSLMARKLIFENKVKIKDLKNLQEKDKTVQEVLDDIFQQYKVDVKKITNMLNKNSLNINFIDLNSTLERYIAGLNTHIISINKI